MNKMLTIVRLIDGKGILWYNRSEKDVIFFDTGGESDGLSQIKANE